MLETVASETGVECGCVELIESWWTEGPDGRPQLNIDDERVPATCSLEVGESGR